MRIPHTILALLLTTMAAAADDVALLAGTDRYDTLDRLPRGTEVTDAAEPLATAGFEVIVSADATAAELRAGIAQFVAAAPDADRLLVALSGRFVTDGTRTWYLSADAAEPRLMRLNGAAVSIESLMQVMAQAPGRAILLLAADADGDDRYDPWLREGIGTLDPAQGVTVLRGEPRDIARFLSREMTQPGARLPDLVAGNGDISAAGYLPADLVLVPDRGTTATDTVPDTVDRIAAIRAETALWEGATALDTADAYANYLDRYPQGRFRSDARAALDAIDAEPNRDARLSEDALRLTRDQRREVQRDLTILDFDTRGIDGIFGPGSRGAILNWQQQNGFAQTSYLTGDQIARLEAQAARRAAELEVEAERQREAAIRADQAYWEETGSAGDEAGLRAYLERHPDGLYAEVAGSRLAAIEEDRRRQTQGRDRAAWDAARAADGLSDYRDYLAAYPDGVFHAEAETRIAELTAQTEQAATLAEAAERERNLGLNALTARLVEARLDRAGLEPGNVDGTFDDDTRRALRTYQRDRGLDVTGYLDEATVVRLLADAVR